LPPDRFFIYALKDEGGMRRLVKNSQLLAFADAPVYPLLQKDSLLLSAFAAEQEIVANTGTPGERPNGKGDTDKRIRWQSSLSNNQQDLLEPLELRFEHPIQLFDSSLISLYKDSTYMKVDSLRITLDSTRKKLTLNTGWLEGTAYHLVLTKGAFSDSTERTQIKTDTVQFTSKRKIDYGKVKLRLRGLDLTATPVLQWIQNEKLIRSFTLSAAEFTNDLFVPGDYQLRILYDANGNGRWDTGQFFGTRRQPEKVQPLDKKISIKPGWTNEYEIDITDR
jgi:hypothetical protein